MKNITSETTSYVLPVLNAERARQMDLEKWDTTYSEGSQFSILEENIEEQNQYSINDNE